MAPTRQQVSECLKIGHELLSEKDSIEKDLADLKEQVKRKEGKLRDVEARIVKNEKTLLRCTGAAATSESRVNARVDKRRKYLPKARKQWTMTQILATVDSDVEMDNRISKNEQNLNDATNGLFSGDEFSEMDGLDIERYACGSTGDTLGFEFAGKLVSGNDEAFSITGVSSPLRKYSKKRDFNFDSSQQRTNELSSGNQSREAEFRSALGQLQVQKR